jgi:hypothetical protein
VPQRRNRREELRNRSGGFFDLNFDDMASMLMRQKFTQQNIAAQIAAQAKASRERDEFAEGVRRKAAGALFDKEIQLRGAEAGVDPSNLRTPDILSELSGQRRTDRTRGLYDQGIVNRGREQEIGIARAAADRLIRGTDPGLPVEGRVTRWQAAGDLERDTGALRADLSKRIAEGSQTPQGGDVEGAARAALIEQRRHGLSEAGGRPEELITAMSGPEVGGGEIDAWQQGVGMDTQLVPDMMSPGLGAFSGETITSTPVSGPIDDRLTELSQGLEGLGTQTELDLGEQVRGRNVIEQEHQQALKNLKTRMPDSAMARLSEDPRDAAVALIIMEGRLHQDDIGLLEAAMVSGGHGRPGAAGALGPYDAAALKVFSAMIGDLYKATIDPVLGQYSPDIQAATLAARRQDLFNSMDMFYDFLGTGGFGEPKAPLHVVSEIVPHSMNEWRNPGSVSSDEDLMTQIRSMPGGMAEFERQIRGFAITPDIARGDAQASRNVSDEASDIPWAAPRPSGMPGLGDELSLSPEQQEEGAVKSVMEGMASFATGRDEHLTPDQVSELTEGYRGINEAIETFSPGNVAQRMLTGDTARSLIPGMGAAGQLRDIPEITDRIRQAAMKLFNLGMPPELVAAQLGLSAEEAALIEAFQQGSPASAQQPAAQ